MLGTQMGLSFCMTILLPDRNVQNNINPQSQLIKKN